jgi:hypothetical protein
MLQVMNDSMNKHTQYLDNLFGNDKNLQIQPSYNGFNMDAYLDWEMTMDKTFAQCDMCDRRKIKIDVSSLTSCALTWWENLCVSNKPQTWKHMKILMREKFYQHDLLEHIPIISSSISNILQDNAQNKEDYTEQNEMLIMSHEVLQLSTDLVPTTSANESKEGEPCTIDTTTISIHHVEKRTTQNQKGGNHEIMHMLAASGVYIQMFPWSQPFTMMGRQGCVIALKITLSQGRFKCKKGVAILRHLLNMVNPSFCSSTNYFENQLLPNDLVIVRDHGDDEEDEWDMKRVLERQGDAHIKVDIKSNLEF